MNMGEYALNAKNAARRKPSAGLIGRQFSVSSLSSIHSAVSESTLAFQAGEKMKFGPSGDVIYFG